MNALVYLKERTRMCDYTYSCTECEFNKFSKINTTKIEPCIELEANHPELAIEIVDKWSASNPPKEYNWHKVNKIKRED